MYVLLYYSTVLLLSLQNMILGPIDQLGFQSFIQFYNQQSLKQPRVFYRILLTNSWSYSPFLPLVLLFCLYFFSASFISAPFSVNCSSVSSRAPSSFAFCCFCNIPLLDYFFSWTPSLLLFFHCTESSNADWICKPCMHSARRPGPFIWTDSLTS